MPATKKKTQKTKSRAKKSPARAKKAPKKKVVPKKAAARKPRVAKAAEKRPKVSFRKELTEKLLADKRRILAEVTHKVKSESEGSKFEIGDIYDIASSERERELYLTLGDREREKLSEIEDALERIKDKSYGECEECGEPIGENRLRALPFTRMCVDCKSRSEREEHIRGRIVEEAAVGMMERSEAEEEEL
jgi:DnaK suppressor protein